MSDILSSGVIASDATDLITKIIKNEKTIDAIAEL